MLDRPIFILGTGRCGSTMVHRTLVNHSQLSWLSRGCAWFPRASFINRVALHAWNQPLLKPIVNKLFPANEGYAFWEHHCKGFSEPFRDLKGVDVSERMKKNLPAVCSKLTIGSKPRLLFKITGWPRIGFLNEIFPDAYFIHVVRDGRAVANSFLDIDFWDGWRGPFNWRTGPLSPSLQTLWEKWDKSFVALAAIHWIILMKAAEEGKKCVPSSRFLEVRYEDVCEAPKKNFEEIMSFVGLPSCNYLEKTITQIPLKSQNHKWKQDLSAHQQDILQGILEPYMRTYNYMSMGKEE